jgi:putative oxidoreductase
MTPDVAHWMIVSGRILMGGFYVIAGVHHFYLVDPLTKMIAARGVPAPGFVLILGSLLQLVAGLLLMVGIFPMVAAIALIIFTLAASAMLLNFWTMQGDERRHAFTQWQCNLALIGGLLAVAVASAGKG